ncbi:MAG: phage portal protein, partial [Arachidicoccus sp.]
MKLSIKQTRAIDFLQDNSTQEVLYGGAAGGGKSVLGCFWILKSSLKYPGTRWLIGRSELVNLKKT